MVPDDSSKTVLLNEKNQTLPGNNIYLNPHYTVVLIRVGQFGPEVCKNCDQNCVYGTAPINFVRSTSRKHGSLTPGFQRYQRLYNVQP